MTTLDTKSTALVLEGGGLRGVFTCGVLDCFMEHGITFPFVGRMEKNIEKLTALYEEGYAIGNKLVKDVSTSLDMTV